MTASDNKAAKGFRRAVAARPGRYLFVLVVAAVAADFAFTGVWTLQENEQGVVLRFGRLHRPALPGLVLTWPWPVEEMIVVNTRETRKMPVGFRFSQGLDPSPSATAESEWLTGDMNIVDVEMMIHYTISDPADYLFRMDPGSADFLIRKCAESVLTEQVGVLPVDVLLTEEKGRVAQETLSGVQALLDQYGTGVRLLRANLRKVVPPVDVIEAFNDVSRAKQDRGTLRDEADAYRRDVEPTARALADQIEQQALVYRSKVLSEAQGKAERFKSICEEYRKAPEITETRLFLETLGTVLRNPQKVVVVMNADGRAEVKVIH